MHPSIGESIKLDESIDDNSFFEVSALLLSLNRKNFEAISSLNNFSNLSLMLTTKKITNLDALYHLQQSIIEHFLEHRTKTNIHHLHDAFTYLNEEGLLNKLLLEKLISLFDPSKFEEDDEEITTSANETFLAAKQTLITEISQLKEFVSNSSELEKIKEYLNKQTFSIGITGVMNAGKSTMLNALMGKEVLGTNVIPETANLTVLKYNNTPSAKVVYWNKSDWEHIQKSAKSIESMATFVEQTNKSFKDTLDSYVLPKSREEEIDIDRLSEYTSASTSDKKCNLVKHVELSSPLDFLQDGIEIVDTPGLDDIVIQREEITKEYLSKCDVILHLMNVSQSATQKDIEFIIDAVLYQNITKVLIVVTHVDMVSSENVKEVIAYTKQSIASKLHEQNSDSKLDFVLKTLHFIALSGKMALLHKTGHEKEAQDAGYSLEKSGIVEVEKYIQETLFGKKNSRSSLIIHSAKNRLGKVIDSQIKELKFENSLLFKTEDEINNELTAIRAKKALKTEIFKSLKEQISGYEAELLDYLEKLQYFLNNELKELQKIIKQRLLDETRYSLEKDKKTPPEANQKRIIESALKHGLIDIIRDYRYRFVKKTSKIYEIITLQFDDIEIEEDDTFNDSFNKGFLTTNSDTLTKRVSKVLNSSSLNKLIGIDEELTLILKDEFIYLETQIKEKALSLSKTLLDEFFIKLKTPISVFENILEHNEEVLQNHIKLLKEDDKTRSDKSMQLYEYIKSLETIAKRSSI